MMEQQLERLLLGSQLSDCEQQFSDGLDVLGIMEVSRQMHLRDHSW